MMLSTRLELEAETILLGISDESRKEHAAQVLDQAVTALRDHESRVPLANALDQVVRVMERVLAHLDESREQPTGFGAVLSQIDTRTWIGIILGITAAFGAATGLDVADLLATLEGP